MKIVTVSQMQKAERDCADSGVSLDMLMENAGKAVAEETRRILGDLSQQNVLVLVGPGNNGGDGLVAARYLYDWGVDRVKVYLCGQRPENDKNFQQIIKRSIHFREVDNDPNQVKFHNGIDTAWTPYLAPVKAALSGNVKILAAGEEKKPPDLVIA
jgi:NAD(P)H-hydrate epimerase